MATKGCGRPNGPSRIRISHILSYLFFFRPCWPLALSWAHPRAATQSRRIVVVNSPPPWQQQQHCTAVVYQSASLPSHSILTLMTGGFLDPDKLVQWYTASVTSMESGWNSHTNRSDALSENGCYLVSVLHWQISRITLSSKPHNLTTNVVKFYL